MVLSSKRAQIPGFRASKEEGTLKGELATYEAKAREKEIEALREEAETYGEEFQKINEFIGEYSQRFQHDLEEEAEGVAAEATVVGAAGGAMEQALGANDLATAIKVVAGLMKTRASLQKRIKALNKRLVALNAEPVTVPGMGGGLFGGGMPHISSKTAGTIFKVVVVVSLLAVVGFYLIFTTTGSLVTSSSAGIFADLKNSLRGVAAPISIAEQVITGKYDPTQLWNSKTYEDKYTAVQDAGVEVSDIKPLQDTYVEGAGTTPTIVGTIKVTDLPEDPDTKLSNGITVGISAVWESSFIGAFDKYIESITERLGLQYAPILGDWTCNPSKIQNQERFVGRFQCSTNGIYTILQTIETQSATVDIRYNFKAVSGKSVYVANFDDLSRMLLEDKDPVSEYKLTSADLSSWQTKSPLSMGMGVVGEQDVIGANTDASNPTPYFLGISIANMGEGRAILGNLVLRVPQSVIPQGGNDNDFKNADCTEKLGDETLCAYSLSIDQTLAPGESVTKYFKFAVPQGTFLNGAPISSFFVLSNVDFFYDIQRTVPIKVRQVGTS